jgi:uncharacterized protein (TIGR02646 family)
MLKLNSKTLTKETLDHLASKQKLIDDLGKSVEKSKVFEEKAAKANSLWKSKKSKAFDEVKEALKQMCSVYEVCVYCECNEATDIEHIYPKKFYPNKAFSWENYVLACGKCNSHLKNDKCSIFKPKGSEHIVELSSKPANGDILFINQRKEDPFKFIDLDLKTGIFTPLSFDKREYERADYTIKLLDLNGRSNFKSARVNAKIFFINRLDTYVNAKVSTCFEELERALHPEIHQDIFETEDFDAEKDRHLENIKKQILGKKQRTVWKQLIHQINKFPTLKELFDKAPEALNW